MVKIGLVLSGGGARGMAHIGALKVLAQAGVKYDAIAGCSIGAIVGACLAAGRSPEEIEGFALRNQIYKLLNFSLSRSGIKMSKKLESLIFNMTKTNDFAQLDIPLYINSTNLSTGKEEVFCRGSLMTAIIASSAIPGIFAPVKMGENLYTDGGVLNQLPWQILPPDITHYIMINVSPYAPLSSQKKINISSVYAASIRIMETEIIRLKLAQLDKQKYILIEPDIGRHTALAGAKQFQALISKGEEAAQVILPQLQQTWGQSGVY